MRFLFVFVMLAAALGHARFAAAEQRVALLSATMHTRPRRYAIRSTTPAPVANTESAWLPGAAQDNLNQKSMIEALREYGNRLKEGDVALFYYSGHGMQVKAGIF